MKAAGRARCAAAVALALLAAPAPAAAGPGDVPAWVTAAVATADQHTPEDDAVVLLNARELVYSADGRVTTHAQYAVRVLTSRGAEAARCAAVYVQDESRVKDIRAWLLPRGIDPTYLPPELAADQDAAPNDVFHEARLRSIDASERAYPGCVFACEWTTEDRPPFLQADFELQGRLAVVRARFAVRVPAGWQVDPHLFNHAPVAPAGEAGALTWEFADLPAIPHEEQAPSLASLAARIAVSVRPAAGVHARSFESWPDVSRWLASIAAGQDAPDAALTARAKALPATEGELSRWRAATRTVQALHYVSIQTGLGRGGGYQPHAAAEVLRVGYGDCKDKANLLCALVRAAGGQAWLVPAYLGDPGYVHEEWPTPQQFNHCIAAIAVADSCRAPAVARDPALGNLLFVDPTDPDTPAGELPAGEQGALVLLTSAAGHGLVRLPLSPAGAAGLRRVLAATLEPDGTLDAELTDSATGDEAARLRAALGSDGGEERVRGHERAWLQRKLPGAEVTAIRLEDAPDSAAFVVRAHVRLAAYAQPAPDGTLLVRPPVLGGRDDELPRDSRRRTPVALGGLRREETVRLALPPGWEVSELPSPGAQESEFGSCRTELRAGKGLLLVHQQFELRRLDVPPARYADLRGFQKLVAAGERGLVVLRRSAAAARP